MINLGEMRPGVLSDESFELLHLAEEESVAFKKEKSRCSENLGDFERLRRKRD